jgi:hypothetical protein
MSLRDTYDAVARAYAAQLADELDHKPLDRALLVSFHVDGPDVAAGGTTHLTSWFGSDVDVDVHFLEPGTVGGELVAAGFRIESTVLREPLDPAEFPSRRAYLMARRG